MKPEDLAQGRATVVNTLGVHARPAAAIVRLAGAFESRVELQKDDITVNAKSILGVLLLAAGPGTELEFRAYGRDAGEAVEALVGLVESGFPGLDAE